MMMYKGNALKKDWSFTSRKAFMYIALACIACYVIFSVVTGSWNITNL